MVIVRTDGGNALPQHMGPLFLHRRQPLRKDLFFPGSDQRAVQRTVNHMDGRKNIPGITAYPRVFQHIGKGLCFSYRMGQCLQGSILLPNTGYDRLRCQTRFLSKKPVLTDKPLVRIKGRSLEVIFIHYVRIILILNIFHIIRPSL